jgi:2-polyprenyl-3-methyl-5-hydroxy-6-metoxy-1,4-benzoquinol methylase
MDYREKVYSTYVSTHTLHLYGEATLERIKKQFPVWTHYYRRFLPSDKSAKILDVGCGNGGFVYWLQQIGYTNASGIDISSEQIEVAKRLGIKSVEQADLIEFLKDKQDFYDVIFARDIIEHFNKDEVLEIFETFYNSIKSGGSVIICTPNGESPFSGRYRYGDFTHEIVFTQSSLSQVLRVSGFTKIAFYPVRPVPKGVKSVVRFLLWRGIEMLLKFYMLVETGSGEGIYTQNIIAVVYKLRRLKKKSRKI